jgi:hypothetical protein
MKNQGSHSHCGTVGEHVWTAPAREEATFSDKAICRHVSGLFARRLEAAGPDGLRGPAS